MKYKKSFGELTFEWANVVFMWLVMAVIIVPFVYMFAQSISDPEQVGLMNVTLIPKGIQWNSYKTVFEDPKIWTAFGNSITMTVIGTVLALIFQGLAAFALSRSTFRARKFFTIMFIITMYFHGGMIPGYLNMKNLGLLDTMWSIILPSTVGMYNIILMRTNFLSIPGSLIESAYIDGANEWYIFFKIVVPLSKAIFATIAVFVAVAIWNNYFTPLLYLSSPEKEPLTILLRRILISNEQLTSATDAASAASDSLTMEVDPATYQGQLESIKMATVFVTVAPILIVYPFAQKYFVTGVMVGSVKG
ncbi:MAG: carbohydrate ABC transporter permease [Clostridia bacterium]|nr:carbohydrate ABC transporter permease [Clostridia bacterium]